MAEEIIAAGHATRFSFFRELSSDLRYDDEFFFLSFGFKHAARNFFSIIFSSRKDIIIGKGRVNFLNFEKVCICICIVEDNGGKLWPTIKVVITR